MYYASHHTHTCIINFKKLENILTVGGVVAGHLGAVELHGDRRLGLFWPRRLLAALCKITYITQGCQGKVRV